MKGKPEFWRFRTRDGFVDKLNLLGFLAFIYKSLIHEDVMFHKRDSCFG